MPDYWKHSGYHLLTPTPAGRLGVTDGFLRAYLMRPEIHPVAESCAAERALHASLLDAPRQTVDPARVAALTDPDVAENYRLLLALFARLVAAGTIEDGYLAIFRAPGDMPPPLFLDQLAQ